MCICEHAESIVCTTLQCWGYVSSAKNGKHIPVCRQCNGVSFFLRLRFSLISPYSRRVTILNLSCKNFSIQKKVETSFKELAEIQGQSTLCITSFVGIINCPVWHCQAATAIVASSQSPKAKSEYNTTHEVAIPVFFGFIYSQSVVTERPDYSSLSTLQLCMLQFLNPSPRPLMAARIVLSRS